MKQILSIAVLLTLTATAVHATITVRRSSRTRGHIDVVATHAPLAEVTRALEPYLGQAVRIDAPGARLVSFAANDIDPLRALAGVANAGHTVVDRSRGLVLRDAGEAVVTLDVKDEDVRSILKSVQRQCGIRNLIINPDVQGIGTFLFKRVPCRTALDTILKTMGLGRHSEGDEVTAVGHASVAPVH